MLVLSRSVGERIQIGENIEVQILGISRGQIRIGIAAPRDINVVRTELLYRQGNRNSVIDAQGKKTRTHRYTQIHHQYLDISPENQISFQKETPMESSSHEFADLFAQLGLPNTEEDIQRFIAEHSLPDDTLLPEAEFWSPMQADFLRDGWKADADWAPMIEQLNMSLHH